MRIRMWLVAVALWIQACAAPASFVLTGTARPAMPENAAVRPFLTGLPEVPYREIGVVEVRGSTLKKRVDRAAHVARAQGGNAIIHLNSNTLVRSSSSYSSAVIAPVLAPRGAFAFGAAPATQVQSVEVDRYVIIFIEPEAAFEGGEQSRAEVDDQRVEVFWTRPPGAHEILGSIEVEGGQSEERLTAARQLARSKGGDALLFLGFNADVETRGSAVITKPNQHEFAQDVQKGLLLSRQGRTATRTKRTERFEVLKLLR